MDIHIKLPTKNNTLIIFNKITELIDKIFLKLNVIHKKMLCKYLYRVILIAYFYLYDDNFIAQLYLNNYQDIFSFLVLLLPYYELNSSKNIASLDELFINKNSKSKSLSSSYYIDHIELSDKSNIDDYLDKYFMSSMICIIDTFKNIHCLLMPNWLNIFPYTMDTYKTSQIYKNFTKLYNEHIFVIDDSIYNNSNDDYVQLTINTDHHFKLGYGILYGTLYNFMYKSILQIKWMIYDINVNNEKIIPNIIYLNDMLKINDIANKPWNELTDEEKNEKYELWKNFYTSNKINKISLKSLVLFYLRWEKDKDKLNELNLSMNCYNVIHTNLDVFIEENNDYDDDNDEKNIYSNNDKKIERCLEKIYPNIKFDNLYTYIYESIQQFKYTWYGFVCLDDNKKILNIESYFIKYFEYFKNNLNNDLNNYLNNNLNRYIYLTPKNIYNFCKSILHINTRNNGYLLMSLTHKWTSVHSRNQEIFINRLNLINTNWFNIRNNIARTYNLNVRNDYNNITDIMNLFINTLSTTNMFVEIICQTLTYNGMFSYFKYNPELTNNAIIPDKNKNYEMWKSYILNKIDILPYAKSYHPFSNTLIDIELYKNIDTMENIKQSMWYTNFGANWIAQIQLYHHYNNNRILFITGATGAGKSTVAPFLLVYAVKILNYNNNAKVVCTQPRTQPVKDNATRISESIGYRITIKNGDEIGDEYKKIKKSEALPQNINYIQYKHKNGELTDELYHPYLRLYTDGSLYNIIKQNYLFIKTNGEYSVSTCGLNKKNLFDIILVDEAHEHNPNMDLILTLSKIAVYINNEVSLGIISATMDDDEIIYRKYYEPVDDNWKAPLEIPNVLHFKLTVKNRYYIDRRIHLSIPFGGMNFDVKEYPNELVKFPKDVGTFTNMKKINKSVMEIVKHILSTTQTGDILIFQPGESDINRLLLEINNETPFNVMAIPFYKNLDDNILENIVKKIDKPKIRKNIRFPKNKYTLSQMNDVPTNQLLPEGTYTRFILLATNIAEASITIDTLVYVIDTGNQKINIYDYDTNQSKLEIVQISVPNQKQRRGRVGRLKPGVAYYTYDRTQLSEKVLYKLNIDNITPFVLDLITSSSTKFIDVDSDPYKTDDYTKIPDCLFKQYAILYNNVNDGNVLILYFDVFKITELNKKNASKIIYPYSDGKYELKTLKDENGDFFIIHPNEDYFERNPKTLEIISKNKKPNYFNKIEKVIKVAKSMGYVNDDGTLSHYGSLLNNIGDFMEFTDKSIDFTKIILDCYSFNLINNFELFKNILMFIVFEQSNIKFSKTPNYWTGKSDFLIILKNIDTSYFNMITLKDDIFYEINYEFNNYNEVIENKVNSKLAKLNFASSNTNDFFKNNIIEIKNMIINFYKIKLKIEIINLNSRKILKTQFKNIFEIMLNQKSKKLSNIYLELINTLMLYYIDSDTFMDKTFIEELNDKLKRIPENDESKRMSVRITGKIDKLLDTSSLFENTFLPKILFRDDKTNSVDIIEGFNKLSDYDKLCFIIAKNFTQNIFVKIQFTEFYINYFNRNINSVYSLEKVSNKYVKTKVPSDIRNYYVFAINIGDDNELSNITVLNENVANLIDIYVKSLNIKIVKNIIVDKEKIQYIHQYNYEDILEKIDKIIEYINKS